MEKKPINGLIHFISSLSSVSSLRDLHTNTYGDRSVRGTDGQWLWVDEAHPPTCDSCQHW
jgi:hypothetical protein